MLTKILSIRSLPAMLALTLVLGTLAAACKKAGIALPPAQADFLNQRSGAYFITGPDITDTIPVGVTTVTGRDRMIPILVSSPTGAVRGTAYSLTTDSVLIPAGQALGTIVVKGNYAFYNGTTRKDTLIFSFGSDKSSGTAPSDFNDSFTLAMRGPCVEGKDFDPAEFNGNYTNVVDGQGSYFSTTYSVSVSTLSTGRTSATLTIRNLGGPDFYPVATDTAINPGIKVNIDWSDPSNLTSTVLSQTYLNTTYLATLAAGSGGTFSSCHQTFVLIYDVLIPAYSFDSGPITTTIAR